MWIVRRLCFWLAILVLSIGPVACGSKIQSSEPEQKVPNNYQSAGDPFLLFQKYCDLEQKQKYADVYSLLSQNRKKYLKKYDVRNAEQYRVFRENSEASWSSFSINRKSVEHGSKVTIGGQAVVEESGEKEKVNYVCVLIKEGSSWRVDDWKYQSAEGKSDPEKK